MLVDNEWFRAEFPGAVTFTKQETQSKFSAALEKLPGEVGVRVTHLGIWNSIANETRQRLIEDLTRTFGDALIRDIATPGFFRRPKMELDELIITADGPLRKLAFSWKASGASSWCRAAVSTSKRNGRTVEVWAAVNADEAGRAAAHAFLTSVTLK